MTDLVLFGIQGSGKGTQAKLLAKDCGYIIFETGAELRRIAATDTEIGRTVKGYIDSGKLAPLDVVMSAVGQAVRAKAGQRILFDGIPRDIDQMQGFDTLMRECGREFQCVELIADEEDCVQRILGRAKIEGRADDANEETIRRRMGIFKEKTVPVIMAYREQGKVTDIDGNGQVGEVAMRLKAVAC